VTYTVQVTDTPPSGTIPTGTVALSIDGTPLPAGTPNPVTLDGSGQAIFANVSLGFVGQHTITATFTSGDFAFANGTKTIFQSLAKAPTQTAVTVVSPLTPPNPVFGQPVTFRATVAAASPSPAGPPTTGTVSFFDGGVLIGSPQAVDGSGTAFITTTSLSAASHTISAIYNGQDPSYAQTVSPNIGSIANFVIDPASTSVGLLTSQNPSAAGQNVDLHGHRHGPGPERGQSHLRPGELLRRATLLAGSPKSLNGSNVVTLTTNSLTIAGSPHNITAVYVTNASYTAIPRTRSANRFSRMPPFR